LQPAYSELHAHFERIIERVLHAADPHRILLNALVFEHDSLYIHGHRFSFKPGGRLALLSVGKAATPMTRAALKILKSEPDVLIVVRPKHDQSDLPGDAQLFQSGHPLPTAESLAAGQAVRSALENLNEQDAVIVLLSGGGSALLELPKPGIEFHDLYRVNEDLLRSGAPIEHINIVRKSMSLLKGGGLLRLAAPARVLSLILSDVVGDDLRVIASGPTVQEEIDPAEAVEILLKYRLWDQYPVRLQKAILAEQAHPEVGQKADNVLLANNQTVTRAAAEAAARLGFKITHLEAPLKGEANHAGAAFAHRLRDQTDRMPDKCHCLIQGGETTVTVRGGGKGGRNQEFALAAAMQLSGDEEFAILSLATDGVDGPTDAAGAIVSSQTINRARLLGADPGLHLQQNNAYPLLDKLEALVRTGPTQTNLNDIAVGLSYRKT
jgi:glycerate 2-kinase